VSGTIRRRTLRAVLIGVTTISALAVTQPTMGYTELKVTGTVGAHSLWDTEAVPGATCLFKHRSGTYRLSHIGASPPRMKAVPGMGTEVVAWSFTVQRRIVDSGGAGPWKDRFTSQKFTTSTNAKHNAYFGGEQGVHVVVPFEAGGAASANYRVIVKLFWYESDGTTILGTATDRVDWYYPDQGKGVPTFHHFCPDYD
jgi:hypothetical protein